MDAQINGKDSETLNEYTSIRRDNLSFDATLDMGINTKEINQTPITSQLESDFLEINHSNFPENAPIRQSKYFASDSAINSSKELRQIIIGGIIFSMSITFALIIQILVGPSQIPNRVGIITQEKVCSDIGAEIVKKGGNSVDAFISSSLCLSVVNPFVAGPGGGGFLLIRDHKHEKDFGINCFFKSSSEANKNDYIENPKFGRKSVAVPGEFKCLQYAYHKYARLYWNTLAEPAIKLATDGFKVSSLLARHLESIKDVIIKKKDSLMTEVFLDDTGNLVKEGAIVKNPYLAKTIKSLVRKESNFYNGDRGKALVDFLFENNDYQIKSSDLLSYSEQETSIKKSEFNDFVLLTTSYPSAGPALKFIVDSLSDSSINLENIKSAEVLAKILEASKMGYIFSNSISDPIFAQKQSEMFNEKLKMAKQYLKNRNESSFPFEDQIQIRDNLVTNFISINDHNDLMVSYIGTLGSAWGSKLFFKDGYFLNNGLSLFSYESDSSSENTFEPGKQPRGLMTPILTYNKKNPCIRRLSISYGHENMKQLDDFGLSELAQLIIRIFVDFSLDKNSFEEKRFEYSPAENDKGVCFEDGFDQTVQSQIIEKTNFLLNKNECMFHSIGLIMKKDHIVYGKTDSNSSNQTLVVLN